MCMCKVLLLQYLLPRSPHQTKVTFNITMKEHKCSDSRERLLAEGSHEGGAQGNQVNGIPDNNNVYDNYGMSGIGEEEGTSSYQRYNRSGKSGQNDHSRKDYGALDSSSLHKVQLKKELGMWDGVGMIVGYSFGSGIFTSPTVVVKYSGSVGMSLVVWLLSGLKSMVGALCCAELGTMIPKSGGFYTYLHEAWGPVVAFLSLWMEVFLLHPCYRAIAAITFANYLLQPFFPHCHPPPVASVRLFAAALLCLHGFINCAKVKWATKVQDVFAFLQVVVLVIIIAVGMIHLMQGNTENYRDPMKGTNWDITAIVTAFYSTLFAYGGWNTLNYVTEELKDPNKDMPRAIAISIITVTVIYVLTNVAYFAVLSPIELLSSNAVAVTFGQRVLGALAWMMSIFVACSTFGTTSVSIFMQARLNYQAAKLGHLPQAFTYIHVYNYTPVPSIVFTVLSSLAALMAPDIGALMTYTGFSGSLATLAVGAGMLWLRYIQPNRERPIKIWLGFPILFVIMNLFVVVLPVVHQPLEVGISIGILLLGLPIYYVAIHRETKPQLITSCVGIALTYKIYTGNRVCAHCFEIER